VATTKAFRISARTTAGEVVASDTVDRRVQAYVTGNALQRIAFSSGDVYNADAGYLIPEGGIDFILQAGDPVYMTGYVHQGNETSFVYLLVTKVG
jgi:hypothetical protein